MSVLEPRKLRRIMVVLEVLGFIIFIPTQLADYHYSDYQWHPAWSYYVYLSGIIMVFIGLGLGFLSLFSSLLIKDKPPNHS